MFCFIALIILSIMGIFSASHRQLAKEAFACVLRRITFRPCNVSFQEKAKGKILGWLLRKSPFLAKFFNKYFEVLSWIFFVLMMGSFAYGAYEESPDKYWQYQSTLFNLDKYLLIDEPAIGNVLKELGFNADKIKKCV